MQLSGQHVAHGKHIDRPAGSLSGSREAVFEVVVGGGRGGSLRCEAAPGTVWVCLRGNLQLTLPEGPLTLTARQALVTEDGLRVEARARGAALWIAILAPREAWRELLGRVDPMRACAGPVLLPALDALPRTLCRRVLELGREALSAAPGIARRQVRLTEFAHAFVELQCAQKTRADRCPGRTLAQRRAVYVRLQRVRRYMLANSHLDLDTADLAARANYSLSHFIRAYRRVYGQTPHAALVDDRLQRAHAMLGSSALAVGEVALASGFENRCAFSRVFKRRFGVTAQEVRRRVAA